MLIQCLAELRKHHLRPTKIRVALLEYLHAANSPLSVPEITERFIQAEHQVNKTTIYRDLEHLVRIGLLDRVHISDEKQYYELSERDHHHHLICKECERVYDVELSESGLLKKVESLAHQLRFSLEEHAIEFYGVCRRCERSR